MSVRGPAGQESRSWSVNAIIRSRRTAASFASARGAVTKSAIPSHARRARPASERSNAVTTTTKSTKGKIIRGCRISIRVSDRFLRKSYTFLYSYFVLISIDISTNTNKWISRLIEAEPCELYCTDTEESVIVPWGEAALDGTPCNVGTRDMCIAGICRVSFISRIQRFFFLFFYNFVPDIISMRIFQIAIDIVESWLRLDGRLGRHGGSLRNMSRRWNSMRDHGRCLRQKWRAGIQGGNHCPQWIEKHQNRRDWEQ